MRPMFMKGDNDEKDLEWKVNSNFGVLYRNLEKKLPTIDKAEGICIYDSKGKKYIDACSGSVIVNIGHGNDHVIEAMKRQAEKITFAYGSQFTSEAAEKLAQKEEFSPAPYEL